jgi:hypothetical protein
MKPNHSIDGSNKQQKKGWRIAPTLSGTKDYKVAAGYIRKGTISRATTFRILIIGLTAGPAVSL